MQLPEVTMAARTLVSLVFLTAAAGKLRHMAEFHGVVANYRILPDFLAVPFAYGIPPLEALIGAALFCGWFSPWPSAAAAALLLLFALAMGINIRRGRRHIDCGCFQSALKQTLSWTLVARNVVLALLLGVALWSGGGSAEWRETIEGVLAGGVSFVILQSLNILWSIVPAWRAPGARFGHGHGHGHGSGSGSGSEHGALS
jgi:uncharacterized membrane protein YphA (DoxX/SURF4 family)